MPSTLKKKSFRSLLNSLVFLAVFSLASLEPCWAWVNQGFETGNLTGWLVNYGNAETPPSAAAVIVPGAAPFTNGALNMVHSGNYACQLFSASGAINPHADFAQIV